MRMHFHGRNNLHPPARHVVSGAAVRPRGVPLDAPYVCPRNSCKKITKAVTHFTLASHSYSKFDSVEVKRASRGATCYNLPIHFGEIPAMSAPGETTIIVQQHLDRLRSGDNAARDDLVGLACGRLRLLASQMLRRYPGVRAQEQTDDVLQNSLLRLHRALSETLPQSPLHFFRLAGQHVRWELLDLAKRHRSNNHEPLREHAAPSDGGPGALAEWAEFHATVQALPDKEREVFDLLWYQGLTQAEAAHALGTARETINRRWQSARCLLSQSLYGKQE